MPASKKHVLSWLYKLFMKIYHLCSISHTFSEPFLIYYNFGIVYTLAHRYFQICPSWKKLHTELHFLKQNKMATLEILQINVSRNSSITYTLLKRLLWHCKRNLLSYLFHILIQYPYKLGLNWRNNWNCFIVSWSMDSDTQSENKWINWIICCFVTIHHPLMVLGFWPVRTKFFFLKLKEVLLKMKDSSAALCRLENWLNKHIRNVILKKYRLVKLVVMFHYVLHCDLKRTNSTTRN